MGLVRKHEIFLRPQLSNPTEREWEIVTLALYNQIPPATNPDEEEASAVAVLDPVERYME